MFTFYSGYLKNNGFFLGNNFNKTISISYKG